MQYLELHEKKQHGTIDFPFEYHHLTSHHPRYQMDYHWHAEYEMIRVLSGCLDMTLDENHLRVNPGELVFIHGGILHSGLPTDCEYECLVFDMNAFLKQNPASCTAYIQRILNHSAMVYHHFSTKYENIHQITGEIFQGMAEQKPGYELTVFGLFYRFFGQVFAEHLYLDNIPRTRKGYRRIIQLKNVLDYIDSNYTSSISLEQLAAVSSMSPKYFCRFFREMTHRTPMDYLNHQRVEHACYELSTTDHSVTDVAYNCGFNDLSYFIKTFRRYKGITPGQYQTY